MTHRLAYLSPMTHVVECRYPRRSHFETIAAFNCFSAAKAYASECRTTNGTGKYPFEYRVVPLRKEG